MAHMQPFTRQMWAFETPNTPRLARKYTNDLLWALWPEILRTQMYLLFFETPHNSSNRDHEAVNRGSLGRWLASLLASGGAEWLGQALDLC